MLAWLNRAWTYVVWTAFLLMAPIWIALWWQRHWLLGVLWAGLVIWPLVREARAELRRETVQDPRSRDTNPRL